MVVPAVVTRAITMNRRPNPLAVTALISLVLLMMESFLVIPWWSSPPVREVVGD